MRLRLFGAGFPHHAGTFARILEGIDQRLDDLGFVLRLPLREERILDRAAERKAFDALRRPVGRDLLAAHAPDLLGVALEEGVEETLAELIAHPILEVVRVAHREKPRLEPGEDAEGRLEDAELRQRLERLQRIGEELAAVKNARGTRPIEHVVRQNLRPEIFDFLRLREEAMPADVEVKTLVGGGARNAADVDRVGFEDGDVDVVLGEEIRCRQSSRPCANNCYVCFHVCLKPPSCPA